jgi:hypothetical protein
VQCSFDVDKGLQKSKRYDADSREDAAARVVGELQGSDSLCWDPDEQRDARVTSGTATRPTRPTTTHMALAIV